MNNDEIGYREWIVLASFFAKPCINDTSYLPRDFTKVAEEQKKPAENHVSLLQARHPSSTNKSSTI